MKNKQTRKIKKNIWGNWNGYEGNKKVKEFGMDGYDAKLWVEVKEFTTEDK